MYKHEESNLENNKIVIGLICSPAAYRQEVATTGNEPELPHAHIYAHTK